MFAHYRSQSIKAVRSTKRKFNQSSQAQPEAVLIIKSSKRNFYKIVFAIHS